MLATPSSIVWTFSNSSYKKGGLRAFCDNIIKAPIQVQHCKKKNVYCVVKFCFNLTLLSQLPATRNVDGREAGLNFSELMLSSGGEVTSKSFIGFVFAGFVFDPNTVLVPNAVDPPPNRLILECYMKKLTK